jgi:hypothetical protein
VAKVSALDLNDEQTTAIEKAVGIPIQRWGSDPDVSVVSIYRHLLAEVNGDGYAKYAAMSNRDILDMVTLEEGDDPNP